MNRENIIRMAREAGGTEMQPYDYGAKPDRFIMLHEEIERFAALVAAAEREACAKALEQALNDAGYATAGYFGAKVIRARGTP